MKCRSLAFGFRAMSLVLVTCTASCISIEGQSPREIKNGLQELFLYKSAHAFSDASAAGPFDARERLRDEQRRYITGEYQRISDSLLEALRQHRGNLEKVFPDMPRTTVQPRISMPDGGNDAPVIGQDGQIYIDIRIARLMFRDSVLASMRSSARSGGRSSGSVWWP